jgi:peptidoglycan/LPS O-acetylase OafA/YrhL
MTFARPVFTASVACSIIVMCSGHTSFIRSICEWSIWYPIATLSYGAYLWQQIPTTMITQLWPTFLTPFSFTHLIAIYVIYVTMSFLAAFIGYVCWEKPIMNIR